ncbi:monovalent cation:proton antiporter-2 (CPA2) family protein [Arenicella xantha]|uniref:Kef-type potassium/proton antiporter (CPA2 family) n=1 Tax=Arenicella xantha TaxID=644221 RepID=A0A395JLC1_9GAMM|nr:monovalent cation:proton antiporter-2 (CPA2) family protein [Arenicella xantha]RBP51399.1 Kef-type potassium/proton antiporter (CPA2 family) [Arenicella xantha]
MLTTALIYLLAAVIAVPIAKRLGLGSVLGYLIAGIIIGPSALQLVGDQTDVMHVAEFGVVMMLFLVGLELQPSRLWSMRKPILGLGGLQVLITATTLSGLIWLLSPINPLMAIAIGLSLALSSTAIVLQSLTERGQLETQAGKNAFSVLLFQDIAVIPILALLPLLATLPLVQSVDDHNSSLIAGLAVWQQVLVTVGVIGAIIVSGRFVSRPLFRFIAETGSRELFTVLALCLVVAIAVAMSAVGLSAALGTFLAGVVLAESEFRHEIEVDIEPFKGLLLGLFFITVGANINFALLASQFGLIICLVIALVALKAGILLFLSVLFKMERKQAILFSLALAQGGEFAFVLTSAGQQFAVFDSATASLITIVVALSMLMAPLLFVAHEAYSSRISQHASQIQDDEVQPTCQVIIAGYGRFGQIVGRLLASRGYQLTILDHSASQIEMVRRFGSTVYYGDAARPDLLEAAGADNARLLVVGVDSADKSMEIIRVAKKHFPRLRILSRAVDRRHAYELINEDITGFQRETFYSALKLSVDALALLGVERSEAERVSRLFAEHDEESLYKLADLWGDDQSYGRAVRQRAEDLNAVLAEDAARQSQSDGDSDDKTSEPQPTA